MFSTLLIPTDLSPLSQQMIECACSLAPLGARTIILLHAMGFRHLQDTATALAESLEPHLRKQAEALRRTGLPVELVLVPGVAHEEISKAVEERHVSAVLLGAEGTSILSELRIGSVTLETLHRCETPLIVARTPGDSECEPDKHCKPIARRILHPTDFSDVAERAFAYVRELVRHGIENVTLLHVQDRGRIKGRLEARLDEFNQIDRARLDRLARDLRDSGAAYVKEEIVYGSPVDEILARSAEAAEGMVVMGTQGRGLVPSVFLGSVSHAVARKAAAPVLLVPARGAVEVRTWSR